ncbi:uncharacterized protein LOC119681780 isoform X1 [Teleopsis dalmanni]|uniref:uncharacterized protein LOC119681780 isoform X1 n=1 Tax=Teleopsis dalmanni TaxID=139649 RepID=UPI0018CC9E6F|nr:uncharacterized protein LOC119681780 isoform X1 [Teleopsis dalmanni]
MHPFTNNRQCKTHRYCIYSGVETTLIINENTELSEHYRPVGKSDYVSAHGECFEKIKPEVEYSLSYLLMKFPRDESSDCYIKCLMDYWNFYDPVIPHRSVKRLCKQLTFWYPNYVEECNNSIEECISKYPDEDSLFESCSWIGNVTKCFLKQYRKSLLLTFII